MIDHLGIAVTDIEASRDFYENALAPLGIELLMVATPEQTESGRAAMGFGREGRAFFWISDDRPVGGHTHIAFSAATRSQVDAFYAAAISAGGIDHGPPGPRPHYGPEYYAAFVLDPDGVNVEAVCRAPR